MDILANGIQWTGEALLGLALNPFYYVGLLFIALLYRRQTVLERKLFFVRLHGMTGQFFRAVLWGWLGGILISVASAGFGLALTAQAFVWVWAVTLALMMFRFRYASFAYAAGIVGLLQLVIKPFEALRDVQGLDKLMDSLLDIHLPSLFALAALLFAAEALLFRINAARIATPLYVEGKRGKAVGAYEVQALWALPLFLVVPAGDGTIIGNMAWPMFFGGDEMWNSGWTLLVFPALIGFSGIVASERPERMVKRTTVILLLFAAMMGLLSAMSELWPIVAAAAAVFSFALLEALQVLGDRRERNRSPVYVHGPRGLKVLDVLAGSPAAKMGVVRGETILRANGFAVSTKEQLHAALRTNSAFCKLEIINLDGHNKFEHRALFDGEHHQLGLVLCPDDRVIHYAQWRPLTIVSLLAVKWKKRAAAYAASPSGQDEAVEHGAGI